MTKIAFALENPHTRIIHAIKNMFRFIFTEPSIKNGSRGSSPRPMLPYLNKKIQNKGWVNLLKAFALRRRSLGKTKKWKMEIKVPLQKKELKLI